MSAGSAVWSQGSWRGETGDRLKVRVQVLAWHVDEGGPTQLVVEPPHEVAIPMTDDTTVLYSNAGGVLTRLQTNIEDLVDLAQSRVQRGFTEAECGRFFPQGDCPG